MTKANAGGEQHGDGEHREEVAAARGGARNRGAGERFLFSSFMLLVWNNRWLRACLGNGGIKWMEED
jgi:hypothetical protein